MEHLRVIHKADSSVEITDTGQITDTAIQNIKTTSSPGFDGLTPSWYRVFWTKVEHILVPCLNEALQLGHMSNTQ